MAIKHCISLKAALFLITDCVYFPWPRPGGFCPHTWESTALGPQLPWWPGQVAVSPRRAVMRVGVNAGAGGRRSRALRCSCLCENSRVCSQEQGSDWITARLMGLKSCPVIVKPQWSALPVVCCTCTFPKVSRSVQNQSKPQPPA